MDRTERDIEAEDLKCGETGCPNIAAKEVTFRTVHSMAVYVLCEPCLLGAEDRYLNHMVMRSKEKDQQFIYDALEEQHFKLHPEELEEEETDESGSL